MKMQEEKIFVIAGLASTAALLVMGLTDHIFYSYRIFLAFWTMMGIVNASILCGYEAKERCHNYENNSQYASVLEIGIDSL